MDDCTEALSANTQQQVWVAIGSFFNKDLGEVDDGPVNEFCRVVSLGVVGCGAYFVDTPCPVQLMHEGTLKSCPSVTATMHPILHCAR